MLKRIAVGVVALGLAATCRAAEKPMLLIVPFTQIDGAIGLQWIGQAVGRSMQSDLSQVPPLRTKVPAAGAPAVALDDPAAASRLAHDAGADYIVAGQFQTIDDQLRLTGQLIDGHTGQAIATLKATGLTRDLFSLEDSLTEQVRAAIKTAVVAQRPAVHTKREALVEQTSGPLHVLRSKPGPVGTVEEHYTSRAQQVGQQHYLYGSPSYGYCGGGGCDLGGFGVGIGGFGGGFGGGFNLVSTGLFSGGSGGLAW